MVYNYLENIKEDVKTYIEENGIEEIDRDSLYDDLFIEDSVTGNASGSYYCNSYKAREAVQGNEDILIEALECFGDDADSYKRALKDPEYADVTIRCYLLYNAIDEVIEDMEDAGDEI